MTSNPVPSNPITSNRWSPRSAREDSFRTLVFPARAEGVSFLTGQQGVEAGRMRRNAAPSGTRSRPFACDARLCNERLCDESSLRHRLRPRRGRGSSVRVCFGFPVFVLSCVRAFLCSCFPEGLVGETGRSPMFGRKPRIGPPMGDSQTPGLARPSWSLYRE